MILKIEGTPYQIESGPVVRLWKAYHKSSKQKVLVDTFNSIDDAVEWVARLLKEKTT